MSRKCQPSRFLSFFCPLTLSSSRYGKDVETLRKPIVPLQRLLGVVRPLGLTVIHTREGHNMTLTDCPANKRWRSEVIYSITCYRLFISSFSNHEGVAGGIGNPEAGYVLTKNTEQWNIIEELAPAPGEDVVDKVQFFSLCQF